MAKLKRKKSLVGWVNKDWHYVFYKTFLGIAVEDILSFEEL
jgi:hypothetical protein